VASITEHAKENPVLAIAAVVLTSVNVGTVVTAVRWYDSLATKDDVAQSVAQHERVESNRIAGVESTLDRVRAFTEIVPQLREMLTLRCMGTRTVQFTIDDLERRYEELTKERFREPPCEQLLATRGGP
jgi:TolA-binding protein